MSWTLESATLIVLALGPHHSQHGVHLGEFQTSPATTHDADANNTGSWSTKFGRETRINRISIVVHLLLHRRAGVVKQITASVLEDMIRITIISTKVRVESKSDHPV